MFLELFVKVRENWRESHEFVEELDWRRQVERLGCQRQVMSQRHFARNGAIPVESPSTERIQELLISAESRP